VLLPGLGLLPIKLVKLLVRRGSTYFSRRIWVLCLFCAYPKFADPTDYRVVNWSAVLVFGFDSGRGVS
jgi:hypothetical protein